MITEELFSYIAYKNIHYSAASNASGNYSKTARKVEGVVVRGQSEPSSLLISVLQMVRRREKILGVPL